MFLLSSFFGGYKFSSEIYESRIKKHEDQFKSTVET